MHRRVPSIWQSPLSGRLQPFSCNHPIRLQIQTRRICANFSWWSVLCLELRRWAKQVNKLTKITLNFLNTKFTECILIYRVQRLQSLDLGVGNEIIDLGDFSECQRLLRGRNRFLIVGRAFRLDDLLCIIFLGVNFLVCPYCGCLLSGRFIFGSVIILVRFVIVCSGCLLFVFIVIVASDFLGFLVILGCWNTNKIIVLNIHIGYQC